MQKREKSFLQAFTGFQNAANILCPTLPTCAPQRLTSVIALKTSDRNLRVQYCGLPKNTALRSRVPRCFPTLNRRATRNADKSLQGRTSLYKAKPGVSSGLRKDGNRTTSARPTNGCRTSPSRPVPPNSRVLPIAGEAGDCQRSRRLYRMKRQSRCGQNHW